MIGDIDTAFPIEKVADIVTAQSGSKLSQEDLERMGKAMLKEERNFNLKAGFSPYADRLPDFFAGEPLPPSNLVFDTPVDDIQSFWDF